jgi:hypothetical protein
MTAVLVNNDSNSNAFNGLGTSLIRTDAGDFNLVSGGANMCVSMSSLLGAAIGTTGWGYTDGNRVMQASSCGYAYKV